MANASITRSCNRACAYCFAREALQCGPTHMTRDTFRTLLTYLQESKRDEIRLLGGEPTMHPQFCDFVRLALQAHLRVVVFSNGLIPQNQLDLLCGLEHQQLTVIVNASALLDGSTTEAESVIRSLGRLGTRAMLGVTLYETTQALDCLLDIIREMRLAPRLRIAKVYTPVKAAKTEFLEGTPKEIAAKLVEKLKNDARVI